MNKPWKIIQHDVSQPWPLADNSVHCIITSPPYWGLRVYEGEKRIDKECGMPLFEDSR